MGLPEGQEDDGYASTIVPRACMFPPALVPLLRERLDPGHPAIAGVSDAALEDLLTVVFFAGLETEEGERYPIRVAFTGRVSSDLVLPDLDVTDSSPMLIYRWSAMPFEVHRTFSVRELVKLAVVTRSERVYAKVAMGRRGLEVVGLAREGLNLEGDPYLKVVAPRPGMLSIRCGPDRLLAYERGAIATGSDDVLFARGPVRTSLEDAALGAGLKGAAVEEYLHAVRAILREMAAHGRGGILVIGGQESRATESAYRVLSDTPLAALLKQVATSGRRSGTTDPPPSLGSGSWPSLGLRRILRGAFLIEIERNIAEIGALTAMDGATVLDGSLGVRAFGVVLPLSRRVQVAEAEDLGATSLRPFDLTTRGTRHRAAASYAKEFPGSIVFVASKDGPMRCVLYDATRDCVRVWKLGPDEFHPVGRPSTPGTSRVPEAAG